MNAARPAFSRGAAGALVVGGFALFLLLLFLLGRGEAALVDSQNGRAHAAAHGLNGYSGLARLLEGAGYDAARSRSARGLETGGLLVLTPPFGTDADELGELLERRRFIGPTLVILPKWRASLPPDNLPAEAAERFERGWVVLQGVEAASWPDRLPEPFGFAHAITQAKDGAMPRWRGLGQAGALPTPVTAYAATTPALESLIEDAAGRVLAGQVRRRASGANAQNIGSHAVAFVAEPDLMNNYAMADPARAAAALALIARLDEDAQKTVTFDLTLNGFGASENLLTLAFRPPFLAATLCLLLMLALVFWRAMLRFGPAAAASGPAIALGKQQLVTNSAALVLRARRFGLLAAPYGALARRRLARMLGLARPDPVAIDQALAQRLPGEAAYTDLAARLEAARTPAEILAAAQALDNLTRKLKP
ncbi:MAG: DUF4350 domain-containing protein [Erythrobacter sp.]